MTLLQAIERYETLHIVTLNLLSVY